MAGMLPLLCASFVADWKTMAFPFLQLLLCISAVGLHVTVAIMQVRAFFLLHFCILFCQKRQDARKPQKMELSHDFAAQAREPWQSHWAELGAFVCGLLPSILFTPGPADKR